MKVKEIPWVRDEPLYGQIFNVDGDNRTFVVLGNNVHDDGRMWCADYESGETVYILVTSMAFRSERELETTVEKCQQWAREGNKDAAWWLGWLYEGVNHPKSVWYYIAAMRRNPRAYTQLFGRVFGDSFSPGLCEGTPEPDLSFLDEIAEIKQYEGAGIIYFRDIRWGDWNEAIVKAENAVHIPRQEMISA